MYITGYRVGNVFRQMAIITKRNCLAFRMITIEVTPEKPLPVHTSDGTLDWTGTNVNQDYRRSLVVAQPRMKSYPAWNYLAHRLYWNETNFLLPISESSLKTLSAGLWRTSSKCLAMVRLTKREIAMTD
jgi:hypothetical protein